MLIYFVDDEENLRNIVKQILERENFQVETYKNGQEAFERFNEKAPDLFILDIMMPVMDGITLLKKIRESDKKVPVVFLTSKDEEFDRILGLELGADDYITKPFSIKELLARVHVIQRRWEVYNSPAEAESKSKKITVGNITLDLNSYTAQKNDKNITLTVTEFRLLEAFFNNVDTVLTREQLISAAYDEETYLNDRAIDCHIKRLRNKIGQDNIQTVYGLGYKYVK